MKKILPPKETAPAKRHLAAFSAALVLVVAMHGQAIAAPTDGDFSDKQKEQIEAVVRNLLTVKDPSIVMTAAVEAQKKAQEQTVQKAQEAVVKNKEKLFNDSKDPFIGNAKGDVKIVEFFDYNCGYCKKANPTVRKLIEDDKNVKLVYKEFPILAESSRTASKYALAALKQKKYAEFHNAVMEFKGQLSDEKLLELAGQVGLDKDRLKKDAESADIAAQINADQDLGREIGAKGTPTFVIGEKVVPGAIELEDLKAIIADARKEKKS